MIEPGSDATLRVVVWMRDLALSSDDPRRSVLSRLRELEAAGIVDEVSVRIWGKSITTSDTELPDDSPPIRERVAEFQQWAERNGHSLEPAFCWSERSTILSEEPDEVIQLPLQCLAIYEDDDLVGVFPCSTDDETRTITDCLHRLEASGLIDDGNAE